MHEKSERSGVELIRACGKHERRVQPIYNVSGRTKGLCGSNPNPGRRVDWDDEQVSAMQLPGVAARSSGCDRPCQQRNGRIEPCLLAIAV